MTTSISSFNEVKNRLDVLYLIDQVVMDSASKHLTDEVKNSAKKIIQSITSLLIQIVSKTISFEFLKQTFHGESIGHQSIVAIYKFDQQLFDKVIHRVFDEIVDEDNFKKIIASIQSLEDNAIKTETYCKLYAFQSRLYEHLWGFECAINIFLKDENLRPEEVDKLTKLLKKIKNDSYNHLKASAYLSSMTDFD